MGGGRFSSITIDLHCMTLDAAVDAAADARWGFTLTHPFGQFLISTLFGRFVEKEVGQSLDRASPLPTYPGYTLILFFHIIIKYYFLE